MQEARLGAVSFLHRFGSSLNAHFHYHVLVLDRVFTENEDGVVAFREATDLTPDHWQTLQRTVQVRVLRHFKRHDLLEHESLEALQNTVDGVLALDRIELCRAGDRPS